MSQVVRLKTEWGSGPQPARPTKKPGALRDHVFFIKEQISVGTVLVCMGRLDPNSRWVVERIVSHRYTHGGEMKAEAVESVRYLSDEVHLRRIGHRERRSASFGYYSYSAMWRI